MVTKTTPREILASSITPSGIEVAYGVEPKRFYLVDGQEVPSVTTVLGVLDKPGLPWWGMKVVVEGVLDLIKREILSGAAGPHLVYQADWGFAPATVETVVYYLTAEKLTVNHVRDKASSRGLAVHDAFETWATTGNRPDPTIFPEEERGYVEGLIAFLDDVNPEPLAAEVMVGSVEHGFAGRYDVRLRITKECQVVFHRTPKKGPQYATLKPGVILGDLKTSKGVYDSHSLQLEGYELASVECGYEPTVARGILHVGPEGTYELVRSKASAQDFLNVLAVFRSLEAMKK